MPDFYLHRVAEPALETPPWEDVASATRPSRITGATDRSYRRVNAQVGCTLTLVAIMYGQTIPQPDSIVGLFTMWPVEVPAGGGNPLQLIPTPGTSALQTFVLNSEGHYTFAVRHENTQDAPNAVAGGVVVLHVESMMVD